MAETTETATTTNIKIDKYDYIQRLLPDLSWLDYIEKEFFTSTTKTNSYKLDTPWYSMRCLSQDGGHSLDPAATSISMRGTSRAIIASTAKWCIPTGSIGILLPLNDYHGLKVYAYFTDSLQSQFGDVLTAVSKDCDYDGYYILLRF